MYHLILFLLLPVFNLALPHSTAMYLVYHSIDITGHIETSYSPFNFVFSPQLVAQARYSNRINETGWAELDLETNDHHSDAAQAYYSGYLEGYLTSRLIDSFRRNVEFGQMFDQNMEICKRLIPFINANLNHTIENVLKPLNDRYAIYWEQVGLTLYQLAGMDDGYLSSKGRESLSNPHLNLNPCGSLLLNLMAETDDLLDIVNASSGMRKDESDHCSALIKWIPESGDILVAHNTWTSYSMMLRILKKYSLNYRVSQAKSVSMSSYPEVILSLDDFYITSTKLVILETSIRNHDPNQWIGMKNNQKQVFEFIRSTVANRMAQNGSEWATLFSHFNSGTYNNQFMIVDYKKLNGSTLEDGALTILEQAPHFVHAKNMTQHLRSHTYWASYNVPYFEEVFHQCGYRELSKKFTDFYDYNKSARAQIFKRDHTKVTNLTTMYHLMRYNDFTHDPYSRCSNCIPIPNAVLTIAARGDLNDPNGKYPIKLLEHSMLGATDVKMTSMKLVQNLEMVAVSGPTDKGGIPCFDWSKVSEEDARSALHYDQPTVWKFAPVITRWNEKQQGEKVEFPYFKFDL